MNNAPGNPGGMNRRNFMRTAAGAVAVATFSGTEVQAQTSLESKIKVVEVEAQKLSKLDISIPVAKFSPLEMFARKEFAVRFLKERGFDSGKIPTLDDAKQDIAEKSKNIRGIEEAQQKILMGLSKNLESISNEMKSLGGSATSVQLDRLEDFYMDNIESYVSTLLRNETKIELTASQVSLSLFHPITADRKSIVEKIANLSREFQPYTVLKSRKK